MKIIFVACIFVIISITNIAAQDMEVIGVYESEGNISDIQVQGDYIFLASGSAGLEIIDISDTQNPCRVGHYQDYRHASLLTIERDRAYLYLWAAYEPLEIVILDISNYSNPQYLGAFDLDNRIWDIACSDTLLFTANFYDGLKIINVAYPNYPHIISTVLPPDIDYGTGTSYIFADPPYCYVGCFNEFMWYGYAQFINILNPVEPEIEYELYTNSFGSLITMDNIGYIATSDVSTSYEIYDISNFSNPTIMGRYERYNWEVVETIEDMCIKGNYSYLLFNENGQITWIEIFDKSDLTNPTMVGNYNPGDYFRCIECSEEYIFLSTENNLQILRHTPTGIDDKYNVPNQTDLFQNYPNPFNARTTISFSLEGRSQVNISIYDITGRLVKRLTSRIYDAGNHELIWDASDQPSGIYFARLSAGEAVKTNRMVLLK